MADKLALLAAVKAYAVANYSAGKGWDYVVEAWTDADILSVLSFTKTEAEAIKVVANVVARCAEYESTAF